jgi:hypothetical protein
MSHPIHTDLNNKIVTCWIRWRRIGVGNRRVKIAGMTRGDSPVENWRRQPKREDYRCDHVGWRLLVRPRQVKSAGTTRGDSWVENWHRQPTREDCRHNHVGFFVGACDMIRGPMERFYLFFYAGDCLCCRYSGRDCQVAYFAANGTWLPGNTVCG